MIPRYLAAITIILIIGMVIIRTLLLKKAGIRAMNFGMIDKKDFIIPPFAIFYFYLVFANAFQLPIVSKQEFIHSTVTPWIGVTICLIGLVLMILSLISFGKSFRVGIDTQQPGQLIRTGIFAFTRNPIYVAFAGILLGQFLVFPNWILLIYFIAASWLIHRQVLREEEFLKLHYGQEYSNYCAQVRRYL